MITFGPVPSRRLGRSLGINNIPPKVSRRNLYGRQKESRKSTEERRIG
jgi:wyosine [tRNA(Phe)-imidazoG37] synthetase (radical SAM superfamily)